MCTNQSIDKNKPESEFRILGGFEEWFLSHRLSQHDWSVGYTH